MKNVLLFVLVLQCGGQSVAQYKVRFIVTESGPVKRENIFISGTFVNWDSLATKHSLLSDAGDGTCSSELNLRAGVGTRGSFHPLGKVGRLRDHETVVQQGERLAG